MKRSERKEMIIVTN
jgi:hypothetical protein